MSGANTATTGATLPARIRVVAISGTGATSIVATIAIGASVHAGRENTYPIRIAHDKRFELSFAAAR